MAPSASDVPNKYDCIINGQGYLFAPSDTGLPPSIFGIKNEFSFTPTFVQRQNTSGDFGDNQQDFWLTATQRDWTLGEQQRFFRQSDQESSSRYWQGGGIDVTVAGSVSMRKSISSLTFGSAPVTCASGQFANFASATNLFQVDAAGNIVDKGAHGLGSTPDRYAMCCDADGQAVLIGSTSGATVGVRRWSGAFSTFTATKCSALAAVNNTLYGIDNNGNFVRFNTAGTATTVFTWKGVAGTVLAEVTKLIPFGGKVLIARFLTTAVAPAELWLYDGTAPVIIGRLPANFIAYDCIVSLGTVFISGVEKSQSTTRAAIYYYSNGTLGRLWISDSSTAQPALAEYDGNVVWDETGTSRLLTYDPRNGGVNSLAQNLNLSGTSALLATGSVGGLAYDLSAVGGAFYPGSAATSSSYVQTSLFDLDSSLNKLFRGIKIDFDSARDGDGGSADIAYRLDDVNSTYTTLQSGAVSGTEYSLSNITGRSISVSVTLNKGTSTNGPVLKRISVRAAPIEPVYKQFQYVLSLAGRNENDPMEGSMGQLRDGTFNPLDGNQQAANLVTAITASSPISVTDAVNGTMSSVFLDQANCKISQIKPGEYIAVINGREV